MGGVSQLPSNEGKMDLKTQGTGCKRKLGSIGNEDLSCFPQVRPLSDAQASPRNGRNLLVFTVWSRSPRTYTPSMSSCCKAHREAPSLGEAALCCTFVAMAAALLLVGLVGCSGLAKSTPPPPPPVNGGALSLGANSLSFGQAPVGTTNDSRSLTVTNIGNASTTIQSMNISNPAFVFSGPPLPVAISASQSLTVNISFGPTAPGPVSGQMSITSDAQSSPLNLSLSGTGTAPIISVNPPSVSFANQTVNSTSGGQTVTVSNTGQAAMSVSQVTVSPSQFVTVGPTPPYTISPGTNVSYNLTFTPGSAQGYTGTFDIASNSFNGMAAVSLSGTGVTATTVLNVSPTTIDFGSQLINSTSGTQTVTLTNGGTSAITLSG